MVAAMVSSARIGGRAGICSGLNEATGRGEVHGLSPESTSVAAMVSSARIGERASIWRGLNEDIQTKGTEKNELPRHSAEIRQDSASSEQSTHTGGSSRGTVDSDDADHMLVRSLPGNIPDGELKDANEQVPALEGPCFVNMLLPSHVVRAVMGQHGGTTGETSRAPWARQMKCSDPDEFLPGAQERTLFLAGTLAEIEDGVKCILKLRGDHHQPASERSVSRRVVPSSAVSGLIGRIGYPARRFRPASSCFGGMAKAAAAICGSLQHHQQLKEAPSSKHDIEVPCGAWYWGGAQPASPDVPLMSPEAARECTKRELVEYLQKTAPKQFLVKSGFTGSVRNIVKVKSWGELVGAVDTTWHARQGISPDGSTPCWLSPSEDCSGIDSGRCRRRVSDTFNVYTSKDEIVQAGLFSERPETHGNGPPKSGIKDLIDFAACNVRTNDDSVNDPICAPHEANGSSPHKSSVKNLIDFQACNFG